MEIKKKKIIKHPKKKKNFDSLRKLRKGKYFVFLSCAANCYIKENNIII